MFSRTALRFPAAYARLMVVAATMLRLVLAPGLSAADLRLTFTAVCADEDLRLDALRYRLASGEVFSVTRLSFLLSGFGLQREDGTWLELPRQYAWMDAESRRSEARLSEIPPGRYRALRYHLGPEPEVNTADPAHWPAGHPLNPNLNGLHWSWQSGYIFLALEGHWRQGGGTVSGYSFHLARDPNRTLVTLSAALDFTHGDDALALELDVLALFSGARSLSFAQDGASTHSQPGDPLATALVANLPTAFHLRSAAPLPALPAPPKLAPLYLPPRFTPYPFTMNRTFPVPALPMDNPLLVERVTLGEKLFHERALSRDGSLACASCHQPATAGADPRRVSVGLLGQVGKRNALPLFNLAWKSEFFWDGRAPSLRAQVLMPMQDHAEMDERLERIEAKLASLPEYPPLFTAAFGSPEITAEKLALALENFLLTLTTGEARFDRAQRGAATLSAEEWQGFRLFMTEYEPRTGRRGADCFHCHGGPLFTDHAFHDTGLPTLPGEPRDPGHFAATGREGDRGKFVTPSLRNVARTAPYMHDGRFATLEEAVAHYTGGVERTAGLDPNLAKHPDGGLPLSAEEQQALVAFLRTLSDEPPAGR